MTGFDYQTVYGLLLLPHITHASLTYTSCASTCFSDLLFWAAIEIRSDVWPPGERKAHVLYWMFLSKLCKALWLIITGCMHAWSPPTCLQFTQSTQPPRRTSKGDMKICLCSHKYTHAFVATTITSYLPTLHLATTCVTAATRQTPIITRRWVSPLGGLETQVLHWHVIAWWEQRQLHQRRVVSTFCCHSQHGSRQCTHFSYVLHPFFKHLLFLFSLSYIEQCQTSKPLWWWRKG